MCACGLSSCTSCNPPWSGYEEFVKKHLGVKTLSPMWEKFLKNLESTNQPLTIEKMLHEPTKINGKALTYEVLDEAMTFPVVKDYAKADVNYAGFIAEQMTEELQAKISDASMEALMTGKVDLGYVTADFTESPEDAQNPFVKPEGPLPGGSSLPYGSGIVYSVPLKEPLTIKPGDNFTIEQLAELAKEPYKPKKPVPWDHPDADPVGDIKATLEQWKKYKPAAQHVAETMGTFVEAVKDMSDSFQNLVSKTMSDSMSKTIEARDKALLKACHDSLCTEDMGVLVIESPAPNPVTQYDDLAENKTTLYGPTWKIGLSPKVPSGIVHFYKVTYGYAYADEKMVLTHAEKASYVVSKGKSGVLHPEPPKCSCPPGNSPHMDGCPAKVTECQDICCNPQAKPAMVAPTNFTYELKMNYDLAMPVINQPTGFVKITDV